MVDELLKTADEDNGLAYVYLDYNDRLVQTETNIIASLIKQLSLWRSSDEVQRLYDQYQRENSLPDINKLDAALQAVCNEFKRVFFVLDALDECEDKLLMSLLTRLQKLDGPRTRFFFTSRPHLQDPQRKFGGCSQIAIKAYTQDIKLLIKKRIEDDSTLSTLLHDDKDLEASIVEEIAERAEDM